MSQSITVKIEGLDVAVAKLAALEHKGRKVLRTAMTKAVRPVVKAVKANIPAHMKHARRSIGFKVKAYEGGSVVGIVGAKTGAGEMVTRPDGSMVYEDFARMLHLLENGRREVVVTRSVLSNGKVVFGKKVRAVAGLHMLAKGWQTSKDTAADILAREVMAGLEKLT